MPAGRKPRAPDSSREQLNLRLTPGEKRAYQLAAAAAKRRNVSDWARLVLGAHITLRGPKEAKDALLGG